MSCSKPSAQCLFGTWRELLLARAAVDGQQPELPARSTEAHEGRCLAARQWEEDGPGFDFLLRPYWVLLGNYLPSLTTPPHFSFFQLLLRELS